MGSPDGSHDATGLPSAAARRGMRIRQWRRWAWFDAVAAFFAATVAGLSLMVPLDPRMIGGAPELDVTLTVFNAPQSTAAGAMLAVVAAVYVTAAGQLVAWSASFACSILLLIGAVLLRAGVDSDSRTVLSFVDCVVAGVMIGTLAPAFMRRRGPAAGFLTGVLSGIIIGGQIQVPEGGKASSVLYRILAGEPSLWLSVLAVVLLGVGIYGRRRHGAVSHAVMIADLPLVPILAGAVVLTTTTLAAEWAARYNPGAAVTVIAATMVTVLAALVAALLLPGRSGVLVLLSAAAGAAGSAVIAVPHPYWIGYAVPIVVAAGVFAGYSRPMPMLGLALITVLSVYAAATARSGHHSVVIPVISCFAVALVVGYCYGSVLPRTATSTTLGIAVLAAPSVVMGLRGRGHGGVGYSVHWYRDPHTVESPFPGVVALAISLGCMAALILVRRVRPGPVRRSRGRPLRSPPIS